MKAGVSHAINVVSKKIKTFRIQVTPSKSSGKKDKTRGQICLPPTPGLKMCHLPMVREGVSSFNFQTFSKKTFLSKKVFGNNFFFKVISPLILKRVWFGLLEKLFDPFRHDVRFSADAYRHQVFSWTVFQPGWSSVSHPLKV